MRSGSTKVVVGAIGAVVVTTIVALLVQRQIVYGQGMDLTRDTMRAVIMGAESTREHVAAMNHANVFDQKRLAEGLKQASSPRESSFYKTIPVVSAWNSIAKVAEKEGFEFRIPKHNARNPKNAPTPDEELILKRLVDENLEEYYGIDEARHEIVYARPIRLTADCMSCHGDPGKSVTADGKDVLGFPMENWKPGEVHGAFLLRASLNRVDAVVWKGVMHMVRWVAPLALALAVGFYFLFSRTVIGPIRNSIDGLDETAHSVANSSVEIASASQSLAQGASEQAASLEETGAALEELSSMIKRNAESASRASQLAGEAKGAAEKGNGSMQRMSTAIAEIQKSAGETAKILKVIDEIAFQTNLLALNAAVEAARAGEAGKGFAVVASEVRNLAQRSAEAARNTAALIEDSVRSAGNGVDIAQEVAKALSEITENNVKVDSLVNEISAASREQAQGITQLNQTMSELDKVTQANAAAAEESASAAQQLETQAHGLEGCVDSLAKLVNSGNAADTPTKPAPAENARALTLPARPSMPTRPVAKAPPRVQAPAPVPAIENAARPVDRNQIPLDDDFADFGG